MFGKLAKSTLGSFSSNGSKSSHFTPTLIQTNEQLVIMVYLIYLSQNIATVQKPSDYATLINECNKQTNKQTNKTKSMTSYVYFVMSTTRPSFISKQYNEVSLLQRPTAYTDHTVSSLLSTFSFLSPETRLSHVITSVLEGKPRRALNSSNKAQDILFMFA